MIKKPIDLSLENRPLMLAFGVIVMVAGFLSYRKLPVDAFPDVSPNLVQVFTTTDGLAPEEIEKYVTYPVETSMNGLPGITKIRSVSNFGLSVVNVYFEDGMDIYFARQLIGERLQEARDQIPEGFGSPSMGPISTGMGLVLFYYIEDELGTHSLEELRTIQDWLVKFHLQTIPGVTEVLGIGGFEKQYQIIVSPQALLRYDLTLSEVIEKIKANNLNVGAQFIEKNKEEFIVRSIGLATSIEDLKGIIVKAYEGTPILMDQIAEIRTGGAIRRGIQTRNGLGEVVAGMVVKLFGSNSSTVIGLVEQRMEKINNILPEGLKLVPYYEQKTIVEQCVKTVTDALLQGIFLVVIVLMAFMGGIRPSIVVGLSIPFSILFTTLAMKYFGISANLMSMGGLAIAIGMMVDGTIVMVENVDRMLRTSALSESRAHVILRACTEVGRPIVFAISIIIIVFLPLFTLQGVEGKTFRPLAYTIALAMGGSLLFAVFIAPVLSSFLMKGMRKELAMVRGSHENFVVRFLLRLYRPVLSIFISRPVWSTVISVVFLGLGGFLFTRLGSEFTPALQEGTLVVRLTMAPSIALEETKEVVLRVEKSIMEISEISGVVTRIGRGEVGAHTDPVNSAEMYVLLRPDQTRSQVEIEEKIREQLGDVPGVLTNFTQPIAMTVDELLEGVRAELAIKLFGDDLDLLKQSADQVAKVVQEVRGAADIQVDQVDGAPQLLITVNRAAISLYGVNVEDVQEVIHSAVGGVTAGQILEGVRRFDIMVRFPKENRETMDQISEILIPAPNGRKIPLIELAKIEEIIGPRQITREDNQRFISIQCNVKDRDIGSFVAEAQNKIDQEVKLPPGYLVTWGGQFRLQQEANKRLTIVIPITLVVVFILLCGNFNSLKNALIIILNIPLALVGGIVALWLTGQNLSVPSSVGFIALFGIALENGMVLVTYINQLIQEGLSVSEACVRGACQRLRPVLMTAMTTALGLFPLLFSSGTGSEVQRPLATVVVGGLVTSTMLTLLIIPTVYRWFSTPNTGNDVTQEKAET